MKKLKLTITEFGNENTHKYGLDDHNSFSCQYDEKGTLGKAIVEMVLANPDKVVKIKYKKRK